MSTLPDFDNAVTFAIPAVDGGRRHEGMLIEGPQGWGEFSPAGGDARVTARWLTAATEPGVVGWPDPLRGRVPVALTIPAIDAGRAHALAASHRGGAVDVSVTGSSLADDVGRVEAVRAAVGRTGTIRCVAARQWDDGAVSAIEALDRAAGGLEYVDLSGWAAEDVAGVRRRVDVRVALDVASHDGSAAPLAQSADVAVLRSGPLGGVRRALRVAESCRLPCVVASSGESSVGLAGAVALAGALPELPFACGLDTVGLLAGDLVADARSLVPVDGHLPVAPMPPGPDRQRLEHFSVSDPAVLQRWRNLLGEARRHLWAGVASPFGHGRVSH